VASRPAEKTVDDALAEEWAFVIGQVRGSQDFIAWAAAGAEPAGSSQGRRSTALLCVWRSGGLENNTRFRRVSTVVLAVTTAGSGGSSPRAEARVCRKARGASNTRMTFSSEPAAYRNRDSRVGMLATQLKA